MRLTLAGLVMVVAAGCAGPEARDEAREARAVESVAAYRQAWRDEARARVYRAVLPAGTETGR